MIDFRNNDKPGIRAVYEPAEEQKENLKRVYERYAYMKEPHSKMIPKWDKWEKQYEAWRPPKSDDDWQSNITPPFTTTIVERALAEMVGQTLQPKITARGPEDVPKAKVISYVKDYTWQVGDGDLELYASLKQALILGKTIWQEDFWRDRRIVKVLKKFDPDKNVEEYEEKTVDDFNDVYGETVSLRDFFIDPGARTINRGRYKANDCIRRYIMNYDTFIEMFKGSIYDQFDAVKYVKPGGDLNYWQFYKPPEGIDKDNQVEMLMYWGRRPDKLIMVANDVIFRDGPNPYSHKQLPFAEGSDVPRLVGHFYAKGEPELLESIQDELTTTRRMKIDRIHMDIWKMFLVSNRETLDDDEAIISPSRFLYVDDPNSIRALEFRDINPSAYREEENLKQDGREVTGVQSPQPSATATEAAIFKETTMKALQTKIWLLSRELLTGITRLRVPNILQYYTTPMVDRIVGDKRMMKYRTIRTKDVALDFTSDGKVIEKKQRGDHFFELNPKLITPTYGGYDYQITGDATFPISKPLRQTKANEFMQNPITAAAFQSGYYDIGKGADLLAEINDFDPEDLKTEQAPEQTDIVDPEQLMEMANKENEMMLQGQEVPPTPYSNRQHTDIHLAFLKSEPFKQGLRNNQQLAQIFSYHILGEEKAQQSRGQGGGELSANPTQQRTASMGIMGGEAKASMPNRAMGQEMNPANQ